jgi:hypothetical protein
VAGDGSAVKSEPSNPPAFRAAELSKYTNSASAMEQSSRWNRVRVKVKVRWMKTVDTVHSTLSLFKKSKISKSKSNQKSVFSEELQWAKLNVSYNQKIWKLSLLRRRSTSKAFTLDSLRATKQYKGGWCKANRPNQAGRKNRFATRKVGPKVSARRREVIAWSESNLSRKSNHKTGAKAMDHLVQQQMRDCCHNSQSMSALAAITISTSIIKAWHDPPSQKILDCWVPTHVNQVKTDLQLSIPYKAG